MTGEPRNEPRRLRRHTLVIPPELVRGVYKSLGRGTDGHEERCGCGACVLYDALTDPRYYPNVTVIVEWPER